VLLDASLQLICLQIVLAIFFDTVFVFVFELADLDGQVLDLLLFFLLTLQFLHRHGLAAELLFKPLLLFCQIGNGLITLQNRRPLRFLMVSFEGTVQLLEILFENESADLGCSPRFLCGFLLFNKFLSPYLDCLFDLLIEFQQLGVHFHLEESSLQINFGPGEQPGNSYPRQPVLLQSCDLVTVQLQFDVEGLQLQVLLHQLLIHRFLQN